MNSKRISQLTKTYKNTLLDDVMPFWLKHGMDRKYGGIMTALDRDGSILDTDKSVWFQGRAGWMFAELYNTVEPRKEWLAASQSCVDFLLAKCLAPNGKLYFSVTREGRPLRLRRYWYSECFAAIACAALAKATGRKDLAAWAKKFHAGYLKYNSTPGLVEPKVNPKTRPMQGMGFHMAGIVTAQQMRENLGDIKVRGKTCTQWIDWHISRVESVFMNHKLKAVFEIVGPKGEVIDHFDGRQLMPGHAIETAWFIMHEGMLRGVKSHIKTGCTILDWMWERGWDKKHGGILYNTDVYNKPVQEYWQDMKFWWNHLETIIATLLAWKLTGDPKYAKWHRMVHDWSFKHFSDPKYGEWYGYLHRDGTPSVQLKGNIWKGPFHLPRALLYCWKLLEK